MPEFSFKIDVANDGKALLLTDQSTGLTANNYIITNINIKNQLNGLWVDDLDKDVIGAFTFPNDPTNTMNYYNPGDVIQIDADDIFDTKDAFIYDNIYTVTIELWTPIGTHTITNVEVLSFLSRYYVNNFTLSYNILNKEYDIEKFIVFYHGMINRLDSYSSVGDSTNIELILKTFKKLLDINGLPE